MKFLIALLFQANVLQVIGNELTNKIIFKASSLTLFCLQLLCLCLIILSLLFRKNIFFINLF